MRGPVVLKSALAICVALANSDCGTATSPSGPANTCSITVSGAQTGTFACSAAAVGTWTMATDRGAVGFAHAGTPAVAVAIQVPGDLATRTYSSTDTTVTGAVTVQTGTGGSTAVWAAVTGASAQGSFSLTLTGVSYVATDTGGNKAYTVHGSVNATAPAILATTATGTVTFHATF